MTLKAIGSINSLLNLFRTRKHSSRMQTARLPTVGWGAGSLYRVGQDPGGGVPVQLGPSGRSLNMPRGVPI